MFDENKRMVTRADGVVFMVRNSKNAKEIRRYVVTKFGNLKLIGTKVIKKTRRNELGTAVETPLDDNARTDAELIEEYVETTAIQEAAATASEQID